jgi:tetratricopeptide (TPR) repeat protein
MDRINKLKEYLLANPDDSFLQHALALEYIKADNDAEARKLFEAILARDPAYVGSYYHLGKLLERIGETESAIKAYETGMHYAKNLPEQRDYLELKGAHEELTF